MTFLRLAIASSLVFAAACADSNRFYSGDDGGDVPDADVGDLAGQPPADMKGQKPGDMAGQKGSDAGMGGIPQGGNVGPSGGTVDRLYFAFHGDTRPMSCNDTANYPSAVIQNIFKREAALPLEFAVSLGDYFFVCGNNFTSAQDQMKIYTDAMALFPKLTFLVMGNHECQASGTCPVGSADANSTVFYDTLKPIAPKGYYNFDIKTQSGLATFVVVADNAWDNAQQAWLQTTLTKADAAAKYTIVMRHHPISNVDLPSNLVAWNIIQSHKYSLFLTGHTHEYKHDLYDDHSGRTVRMGAGGAPFNGNGTFYGFGTVLQGLDDRLYVTVYDQQTNNIMDSWSVTPQ